METSISKDVTKGYLIKFALPTMLSMVIMSLFGIVDGIFVSRLIDHSAFAAVNIAFPFFAFAMAIGFMLGVGGNALIAKKLGEGKDREAKENFTLITLVVLGVAVVLTLLGFLFPGLLLNILGADESMSPLVLQYLQPFLIFLPTVMLSMVFQQFFITVGKAHIITITATAGGLISAGSNYFLIYVLDMGLTGAAVSTSIGASLSAFAGIFYFTFKRSGSLYFVVPKIDLYAIARSAINGASEMVTMLAVSITTVFINNILMQMQGFESVAAIGIAFAGMGIMTAVFVGYSSGIAPIISYNYGKGDTDNLKKVYKYSLRLLGIMGAVSVGLAWLLTAPILWVYDVPAGTAIHDMALVSFRIFTAGYIFMAYNAFASMMFTALNNGKISSLLSFSRTLVFVLVSVSVLPEIFGLEGVWITIPFAEFLGIIMTVLFFKKMKGKYKYA